MNRAPHAGPSALPRSLWILALGNFAVGTSALAAAGLLGVIATDLQVPLGSAGAVITAYALTYAVSAVLLGGLTARLPRKTLLLSGLTLFTLGNIGAALAPSFTVLLIARALSAIGASLFTPVASGVAAALVAPDIQGRALALVFVGIPVANVLGMPLGTWIGGQLGWRVTFWLIVGLGILALLGVIALTRSVPTESLPARWTLLLRRPTLMRSVAVIVLLYLGQFMVYPYLVTVLHGRTHLSDIGVTAMLLGFGLAGLLGNWLGGRLTDHWDSQWTLWTGLSLTALGLLLLPIVLTDARGVLAAILLWSVGALMVNPPQQAQLVARAPDATGMALALNASALYLGQALGAPLGGMLAANHLSRLGTFGGLVALAALAVSLWSNGAKHAEHT